MAIDKLYWEGAKLVIHLNDSKVESYGVRFKDMIYYFRKSEDEWILNLTNISDIGMLPAGNWELVCLRNGLIEPISFTLECVQTIADASRLFPYGENYYIYTVDFLVKDNLSVTMITEFYMRNKHPQKRNYLCESKNIKQYVLKVGKSFCEHLITEIFNVFSFIRNQKENRILLLSEARSPISGNLKAIDSRIKEAYSDYFEVDYYFSKFSQKSNAKLFYKWLFLCWKIAGCKFVIVDDYTPILKFINTKGKVKVIQVWHAGVGFKAVGYARFGKEGSPYPYASGHRKYDYVIVGAKGLVPIYEEVFGVEQEKILPFGLPRLDGYLENSTIECFKNEFYERFPELKDKKIILFAPTYRGKTQKEAFYPYEKINIEAIKEMSKDGYVFGIKMHPFIKESFEVPEDVEHIIYDFTDYSDINELFYVTDILITDYSSNIYEYSLMHRPLILYAYDYDEYKTIRGLQTDLRDLEFGKIVYDFNEIVDVIHNQDFNMDGIDDYLSKYHINNDMRACDRIIEEILLKEVERK